MHAILVQVNYCYAIELLKSLIDEIAVVTSKKLTTRLWFCYHDVLDVVITANWIRFRLEFGI